MRTTHRPAFCAAEQNKFFKILQHFTLKLGMLFRFATIDKNVLRVKGILTLDITIPQWHSNVEPIYSVVVTIFTLAIALLKNRCKPQSWWYNLSLYMYFKTQYINNLLYYLYLLLLSK